jgi:hypothetical protein
VLTCVDMSARYPAGSQQAVFSSVLRFRQQIGWNSTHCFVRVGNALEDVRASLDACHVRCIPCFAFPAACWELPCCVCLAAWAGSRAHALALCSLPDSARCNRDIHHSATCIHFVSALLWQAVHLKELMVSPPLLKALPWPAFKS